MGNLFDSIADDLDKLDETNNMGAAQVESSLASAKKGLK